LKVNDFESDSINGIILDDFRDSVLLRNVEQDIRNNIQFQCAVAQSKRFVKKWFNFLKTRILSPYVVVSSSDLNEDMMMNDKTSVVNGHTILDNIVVEGDVKVCGNCTVGGVDVSYWGANAVRLIGNFIVSAPVNFEDITFESSLKLEGKLDGVQFYRDLLMTLNDLMTLKKSKEM
jgi:hypothetical protein